MDLATMRAEVKLRGFGHIPDGLLDRWINLTYQDINDRFPWPFLEVETSGVPPFPLPDFGNALSVVDLTDEGIITWADLRDLREADPAMSSTGAPAFWYMDGSSFKVYPSTTNTISVRYVKVAADLVNELDVPLSPSRYHYLCVEGACGRAYKRAREDESAAVCFEEVEVGVQKMANKLLVPNYDSPADITLYGGTDW